MWERTPRHEFIPERIWRQLPERCELITSEQDRWALIHSDEPVVTQLDDGREGGPGIATSSNSMPSMVARMLGLLNVHDGAKVLEIGTATGQVADLLCGRCGDGNVTSVEIDRALSVAAAENLNRRGHAPTLVVGDGEHGHPAGAPYDRIIATCALRHVPYELVEQLLPGGLLVAPRVGDFWCGALFCLTVDEDGTASGPFAGTATYMPMRAHRGAAGATPDTSSPRSRSVAVLPQETINPGFALYAGARLPGVTLVEGREDGNLRVWVTDGRGSGAIADADGTVTEFGDRGLWADVEAAWSEWDRHDRPSAGDMGLTVTKSGESVWLRRPAQVVVSAKPPHSPSQSGSL
ncbi:methyltransferase domain-containing protein [Streptomyces nigrescens]|uniref:methyltransferase domain-containing protein n=1 Tax=Streptomyces nigrescens TaxID=1920 RepID=UPI0029056C59|nr:methyltransferase domain-containing protein [Streptomyces nigrescens]